MNSCERHVLAALLVGVLALAGCGSGGASQPITLHADSSSGGPVEVSYDVEGLSVTETVETPWSLEVELEGRFDVSFIVSNPADDGLVSCAIDGLSVMSNLDAAGEGGAECMATGSISGDSLDVSSRTGGVPRTNDDGSPVEADVGFTAELVVADEFGEPIELTQFQPFGVYLVLTGLDIDEDAEIIVDAELVYEAPGQRNRVSVGQVYGVDDIVDGTLVHEVADHGFARVVDTGRHVLDVTGSVRMPDVETPVPIDLDVVEFDVERVEVETVGHSLVDGVVTLDAPNSWTVSEPVLWTSVSEDGVGTERALTGTSLHTLAVLADPTGEADVQVLRSPRPLSHPGLEEAAVQLNESLSRPGVISTATVSSFDAQRIELQSDDTVLRIDVLQVEDEYFVIQVRAPADEALLADAMSIADSVAFDPAQIPLLSHWLLIGSTIQRGDDALRLAEYHAPANWIQDGTWFTSPDGLVGARLGTAVEGNTVESMVATLAEDQGYLEPASPTKLDGVDFLELSMADDDGVHRDFVGMVQGAVLVFSVADIRLEPDAGFVDAIIETLVVFDE